MADSHCATARDWLQALRPAQWTKNLAVTAAFLFALGDHQQYLPLSAAWRTASATLLFCLFSSAIYLLNDVCDRPNDRKHPVKRNRPIAVGRISPPWALGVSATMAFDGLLAAWALEPLFAMVAMVYLGMHIAYSLGLKKVALLDVFCYELHVPHGRRGAGVL